MFTNSAPLQSPECSAGNPGSAVCIDPQCHTLPFLCDCDGCSCRTPHQTHPHRTLTEINELCTETEKLEQDCQVDLLLVQGLLQKVLVRIGKCQQSYRRVMGEAGSYAAVKNFKDRIEKSQSIDKTDLKVSCRELKRSVGLPPRSIPLIDDLKTIQQGVEGVLRAVEELWREEQPVRTSIMFRIIRAGDLQEIDSNTTHLVVRECSMEHWLQLGVDKMDQLRTAQFQSCQCGSSLLKSLASCPKLSNLTLYECGLTDTNETVELLSCMSNLTTLNIGKNELGENAVRAIAASLKQLRSLDIDYNPTLGDTAIAELAHGLPQLESLQAFGCSITDQGATVLARNMSRLRYLDIGYNSGITWLGVQALVLNLRRLTFLDMASIAMGEEGAQAIAGAALPRLSQLHLGNCLLTDQGVVSLSRKLPNLTVLRLERNNLGFEAGSAIAYNLSNLQQLYLDENSIGEGSALLIAKQMRSTNQQDMRTLSKRCHFIVDEMERCDTRYVYVGQSI